jgi:pilus assembly protein CpaF
MQTPSLDLILPYLPERLRAALVSDAYSELCICENGLVFAEMAGRNSMEQIAVEVPSQEQLRKAVNAIARLISRREADEKNPILEARLPDGARVAAMMPPIVQGITLTVRKFRENWFALDELVTNGTMSAHATDILSGALDDRSNILVSGATGAGKSTLVKALLDLIPPEQRVILIEDTAEIPLERPNRARFEAHPGITIRDLVKASLRHRPDRLIVGEVRDGAAYDLLQALNTGQLGSLSTLHASSAQNALNRLARLALQADLGVPFAAIQNEIGDVIHYVVHVARQGGQRRVTELLRVDGFADGQWRTRDCFARIEGESTSSC